MQADVHGFGVFNAAVVVVTFFIGGSGVILFMVFPFKVSEMLGRIPRVLRIKKAQPRADSRVLRFGVKRC